jgi:hypothetical protein
LDENGPKHVPFFPSAAIGPAVVKVESAPVHMGFWPWVGRAAAAATSWVAGTGAVLMSSTGTMMADVGAKDGGNGESEKTCGGVLL